MVVKGQVLARVRTTLAETRIHIEATNCTTTTTLNNGWRVKPVVTIPVAVMAVANGPDQRGTKGSSGWQRAARVTPKLAWQSGAPLGSSR